MLAGRVTPVPVMVMVMVTVVLLPQAAVGGVKAVMSSNFLGLSLALRLPALVSPPRAHSAPDRHGGDAALLQPSLTGWRGAAGPALSWSWGPELRCEGGAVGLLETGTETARAAAPAFRPSSLCLRPHVACPSVSFSVPYEDTLVGCHTPAQGGLISIFTSMLSAKTLLPMRSHSEVPGGHAFGGQMPFSP